MGRDSLFVFYFLSLKPIYRNFAAELMHLYLVN